MNYLFKKTEKALYEYKNIDLKIANIELYIKRLINDVSYAGVSFEEKSSPTNAFNSNVENEVIHRDEKLSEEINSLNRQKNDLIMKKKMIENGLESLGEEEYKLVSLKYLNKKKMTWIGVGMELGMDKDNCSRAKGRIINHLTEFMFPNNNSSDF
ncbi:xanthine dehydrogenase [Clostridium sp.]|uniref:xanthine dehydrogenase n=1 Tax=Clostridium sp. TaxID=1506 RepID=UPI002606CE42|nr:xanthine dehydrogenase [Clostridium sp.]